VVFLNLFCFCGGASLLSVSLGIKQPEGDQKAHQARKKDPSEQEALHSGGQHKHSSFGQVYRYLIDDLIHGEVADRQRDQRRGLGRENETDFGQRVDVTCNVAGV
jgi:hypothetical protein